MSHLYLASQAAKMPGTEEEAEAPQSTAFLCTKGGGRQRTEQGRQKQTVHHSECGGERELGNGVLLNA